MGRPDLDVKGFNESTSIKVGPFRRPGKRKHLRKIDYYLDCWGTWKDILGGEETRMSILTDLINECDRWTQAKSTKKHVTDNTGVRRGAVKSLREQAMKCLKFEMYLRRKVANRYQTMIRKDLTESHKFEALSRPKHLPRVSASAVNNAIMDVPILGSAPFNMEGKTADNLTMEEYELLQVWVEDVQHKGCKNPELTYWSREQRVSGGMLFFNAGLIYRDPQFSETFDTTGPEQIYAVDEYGNFFARRASEGVMHHSSFCRGKSIICAGEISCANGSLNRINNMSGHYQPSRNNLMNAVLILQDMGINIRNVVVELGIFNPPGRELYQGHGFVTNGAPFKTERY